MRDYDSTDSRGDRLVPCSSNFLAAPTVQYVLYCTIVLFSTKNMFTQSIEIKRYPVLVKIPDTRGNNREGCKWR